MAAERIVVARNRYNDLGSQWSGLRLPDAGDVAGRHRRERLRGLLREHADILETYERLLEVGSDGGGRGVEARLQESETRIEAELTAIRKADASANGRAAPRGP